MVKVTSKRNFKAPSVKRSCWTRKFAAFADSCQVAAYMALSFAFVVGLALIGLPRAPRFSKRLLPTSVPHVWPTVGSDAPSSLEPSAFQPSSKLLRFSDSSSPSDSFSAPRRPESPQGASQTTAAATTVASLFMLLAQFLLGAWLVTAQPSSPARAGKSSHVSALALLLAVAPLLALSTLAVFCHEANLPAKWVSDSDVLQDVTAFHAAVEALAGQDAVAGGSTYLRAAVHDSHLSPAVLASQIQFVTSVDVVPLAWSTLLTAPSIGVLKYFLSTLGLQTVPNARSGDCFWLAIQSCTHLPPDLARRFVADWLACHPTHPAYPGRAGLAAEAWATESHVNATVQAMPCCFARALLVFHEPAAVAVLFQPNSPPHALSLTAASALVLDNAATLPQFILYTEDNGVGHFEELRPAATVEPPCGLPPACASSLATPATCGVEAPFMYGGMNGTPPIVSIPDASSSCTPPPPPRSRPRLNATPTRLNFETTNLGRNTAATALNSSVTSSGLHWCQQGPPQIAVQQATNSFVYVPLLHAAAGTLAPAASHLWASCPFSSQWRSVLQVLQTPVRHELLGGELVWGPMAGRHATLPQVVAALREEDGYLPPIAQDALLQTFGGDLIAEAALQLADSFRQLPPFADTQSSQLTSPPARQPSPCFLMTPDAEVEHWLERLLQVPEAVAASLFRQMPLYTQYIQQHSMEEVAEHMILGINSLATSPMTADHALEVAPRLGAVMPLPFAVYLLYCARTTAKPVYFLSDLAFCYLANLLHTDLKVQLYPQDPNFRMSVKYWALPTGDTTAGKSPSYSLLTKLYTDFLRAQGDKWPWAESKEQNLHSNGTHGLFNERMREHAGHVCFTGPEAVCYLSPSYPERGVCDTSAYVNIPKLLECATGGSYKWGTALEKKQRRAAAAARAQSTQASNELPPINFDTTNVNVCWFQQVDVLRDWWVVAEHKRHLGFVGRMVLGFSLDVAVPPNCRRNGADVLKTLLEQVWQGVLTRCGPLAAGSSSRSSASAPAYLSSACAHTVSDTVYHAISQLRAERRRFGYGLRGALGKWEYWFSAVSFLNNAIEASLDNHASTQCISAEAAKCGLRFLDQRLLFGANVLQTEMSAKFGNVRDGTARHVPSSTGLSGTETSVAELFRSVTDGIVSHSIMHSRMAAYRRRQGESEVDVRARRRAVWEHASQLGLGEIRPYYRSEAFFRAPRSGQVDEALQRLSIPVQSWVGADIPASQSAASTAPTMLGGMKRPAAKAAPPTRGKPAAAEPVFGDTRDRMFYKTLSKNYRKLTAVRVRAVPQLSDAIRLVTNFFSTQTIHGNRRALVHVYKMQCPTNFRFTCGSCVRNTCSWAGFATYIAGLKALEIWALPADQHGQPSDGPSNRGRKRKQEADPPNSWIVPGEVLDDDALRSYIKDHFYKQDSQTCFKVSPHTRRLKKENRLKCEFSCTSHLTVQGKPCPWSGTAWYELDSRRITLVSDPAEKHAPCEKKYASGLTVSQQRKLELQPGGLGAADAYDILCSPVDGAPHQELRSPPKMSFLVGWTKRRNRKLGVSKRKRCNLWQEADFHSFISQLKATAPVGEVDELLRPHKCRVQGKSTSVALLSPALVKETLQRLASPRLLKLCLDGTYRLLFGNYALLSVGVLSKQWSSKAKTGRNHEPCRSTFNELGFSIAHAEDDLAYTGLVQGLFEVARDAGCDVDASCVRQWHADMHTGISKARRSNVPDSIPVDDWAHVIGATAKAGNGGARKLLAQKMHGSPEERASRVSFLISCMYMSRTMPAHLFHVLWSSLLKRMEVDWASPDAANSFATHYLCKEPAEHAESHWSARWRAGYDRLMPGSACGTAPQESWHRCTLKRVMKGKSMSTPADLTKHLQRIVRTQLVRLRHENRVLHDWPGPHAHVDLACLTDDVGLGVEGRTSAKTLLEQPHWYVLQDEAENHWFLFPRSLLKQDPTTTASASARRCPKYVQRDLLPLPPGTLRKMVDLVTATSEAGVTAALHALDLASSPEESAQITNWGKAKELFGRWCLVLVGPRAREYWQHVVSDTSEDNIHARGLCTCHEAALHGPCEHLYAAFLHLGFPEVSLKACMQVRHDRGGRNRAGASLLSQGPPQGSVRPGPRVAVAAASARTTPSEDVETSSAVDADVSRLLHQACPADVVSKRIATLSALGVHTMADLKLLTETHLRTDAGFTLGETLRLQQLLSKSRVATPAQPRKKSSKPVPEQRTSQAMTNVMAGTDPANWVVQHAVHSQPRIRAEDRAFLASVTHDALYDMPWDARSASSARESHPSITIGGRRLDTLKAIANHFGIRARASDVCFPCLHVSFQQHSCAEAAKSETIHALLDLKKRPCLVFFCMSQSKFHSPAVSAQGIS